MRRDMDLFSCYLLKCSNNSFIIGYSTLEKDMIAYSFFPYYFLYIILNNGIGKSTHQVILGHTFLLL